MWFVHTAVASVRAAVACVCTLPAALRVHVQLMPNMYFGNVAWWDGVRSAMRKVASKPWRDRDGRVVWRGACGSDFYGTRTRVEMLAKWGSSRSTDFAFTTPCPVRAWKADRGVAKDLPRGVSKMRMQQSYNMPIQRIAGYRYQLNLPGAFSGTYSRNLQFVLSSGGVVMQHEDASKFYEFYYSALKEWEHYVPVTTKNFDSTLRWLHNNEAYAESVAQASLNFTSYVLSGEMIALYWKNLLDSYAKLQRFEPRIPSGACTCYDLSGSPQVMKPVGLRGELYGQMRLHQGASSKLKRDVPICRSVCKLD